VSILHPYSDTPENKIQVLAYSYSEVFAEKIRALGERTRPRDLYDVISLFRQADNFLENRHHILDIVEKKCIFKNITPIIMDDLKIHYESCKVSWEEQLSHQILMLPPFDSFWNELPIFFTWLYSGYKENLSAIEIDDKSTVSFIPDNQKTFAHSNIFEILQFSAASRVCLKIHYKKLNGDIKDYLIEPYSLRKSSNNKVLLYAVKHNTDQPRCFHIDNVISMEATSQPFQPKYAIEIPPYGNFKISSKSLF
jgi:hypothetical protein